MQARKENKSLNRHKEMKNKLNKLKNNKIKLSNMVKSKGPHISKLGYPNPNKIMVD